FARKLTARGIRVLVYNYKWGTPQAEAKAAAAGLRRRGVNRVILVWAPLGAGASLVAAASQPPGVVGVVSLSAESFLPGVPNAVRRLVLPVVFAASEDDGLNAGNDAKDFYAEAPSNDKRLILVPG